VDGNLKPLIHSTDYKRSSKVEGLIYWLHFGSGGEPKLYLVPFEAITECVMAIESVQYTEPLVPRVCIAVEHRKHIVALIWPRWEWAKLFLDWMKEIRSRKWTVNGRDRNRLSWW
jgi:hypothetical protein